MDLIDVSLILLCQFKHISGKQSKESIFPFGHHDLSLFLILFLVYYDSFILHSFQQLLRVDMRLVLVKDVVLLI